MAGDIRDLVSPIIREHTVFSSGMWFALVLSPAPLTVNDDLFVIIPEISQEIKWGPCRWMPRILELPVVGTEALVVFDNRQQVWVVGLWP